MKNLQQKYFWKDAWAGHIENYLLSTPRTGFFISGTLKNTINHTLELACGSSRDSIYLAKKGYESTASDFDDQTISYLQQRFGNIENLEYKVADAFKLPFKDSKFDLVYHNGFFVLFNKNSDICKLLKEQERVAKKYILILVHNQLNKKLIAAFKKSAKDDEIYNIRFFTPSELEKIIHDSQIKTKKINLMKFGSSGRLGVDSWLLNSPLKNLIPKELVENISSKIYQYQSWSNTERIACLIELEK